MPRSGGVYNLPPGYLAVAGQKILASQHNPPLEDIAQALTGSLPRDGTGPMQGNLPVGGFRITGMADGIAPTDGATLGQATAQVPIGSVMDYAGAITPPNWLLCFGQEVSRSTFAQLFAVLGTTYGAGNGATTFNLPDLRGRVVAGKDDMGGTSANRLTGQSGGVNGDTLGGTGGAERHGLTALEGPLHNHSAIVTDPGHVHPAAAYGTATGGPNTQYWTATGGNAANTSSATTGISVTITNSGNGAGHNNVQPTLILNKIIKALAG